MHLSGNSFRRNRVSICHSGVEINLEKAVEWYQRSAKAGNFAVQSGNLLRGLTGERVNLQLRPIYNDELYHHTTKVRETLTLNI